MPAKKGYTLTELAKMTKSKLIGDPKHVIENVADLEAATPSDASFLNNSRYEQAMRQSKAGVVFIDGNVNPIEGRNFLVSGNPTVAFQLLIDTIYGKQTQTGFEGIHETAVIHKTAQVGTGVTIGPYVVIDQLVVVGEGTSIGAGTYIGPKTTIGTGCVIHPRVTIRENIVIGNRVHIQPGVVIGSCGYGYATDQKGHHTKLNQVGNVILEDDVEIGANSTIDRARFKSTKVGQGTKIDNLVMIAHGVIIGKHCFVVAQSGIAGSSEIGNHVILAGQTAVAGHIKIADKSIVTGRSAVSKSITKAGEKWGGVPVMPLADYNRNSVLLRNMDVYVGQIKELQGKVAELEKGKGTKET
jgi:UDP-3-O-[3-hydroxymyristoyl] glucosamine N-acyltransferase